MFKLNNDVLFLILEELKNDRNTIYSCLLVDRTWCKLTVQILWKDPWKHFGKNQLDTILLHLPSKTKENLQRQGTNLLQQKPLFNYIGFCKYLNIHKLQKTISAINLDESIRNEIFNLFINKTKLIHLSIPSRFDYQMDLISAESCFSGLKSLQFSNDSGQDILEGLTRVSNSIKELKFTISSSNNSPKTVRLIEAQENLTNVHFIYQTKVRNELFCKLLEESLLKHADAIQHLTMGWKPITKILSNLINLISLELKLSISYNKCWDHLEDVSLPVLKILKANLVPSKILASLIQNTKGYLAEINIHLRDDVDNIKLIQTIYQNSSENLKYLEVRLMKNIISEFETLLINCQNLNALIIITGREEFDWNNLFKTLTKSSPTTLFKFKFCFYFDEKPSLESFELFFNNWKDRYPMLLQTFQIDVPSTNEYLNLFKKYKTKGIIKKYDYNDCFENFEWMYKRID